jgi:ABC-type lipoprotein release transport system permease subunit
MVLCQGLKLASAGLVCGIAGALLLAPRLSTLLYGLRPVDPLTFTLVPVILTAISLAACYVPARRATRVSPLTALRCA